MNKKRTIKQLRESAGELNEEIQRLGNEFNERKKKRDAGEDCELWPDDTKETWERANQDYDAVQAAIREEESAAAVAARVAATQANTTEPTRAGPAQPQLVPAAVPARASAMAGTLKAFRGEIGLRDAYASGQWVLGALFGRDQSRRWCDENGIECRALEGGDVSKGGALIPQQFSNTIIRLVEEYGIALNECQVVPMTGDNFAMPRRTGGVTLYAVNDNDEITASDAGWDAIELTARKWGALVKYSSELSEDAVISLADFLATEFAWAAVKKMDESMLVGDGTSTYHGIVGVMNAVAAGSEVEAASGNTAFSTLDLTDFEAMVGKLPTYAEANAEWIISKAGYAASMLRLLDAAGGNTVRDLQGKPMREFLGYPVVFSPAMNSTLAAQTSTEGLAFFGDFRQSVMIGMRRDIRMKVSESRYFEYDQLGFLGTIRFDINVHERGTSAAAGSIIQLKTPSS